MVKKEKQEWVYRRGKKLVRLYDSLEKYNWFIRFIIAFTIYPRFWGVYQEFVDLTDNEGNIRRVWVREYKYEEYKF